MASGDQFINPELDCSLQAGGSDKSPEKSFLAGRTSLTLSHETPSTSTIEGTPSGEVLLNFRHQEGGRSQAHGQSHGRVVDFPGPTDSTPPGGRLKDLQSQLESLREKESTLQREIATLTSAHNQTLTDQCSIFGTVQGTSGAVRSQLFERTDEMGVPPGSTRGLQHNILCQNTSMADTVQQNSGHSRAQMPNYYDRADAGINGQLGGTRYDLNYTNSGSGMDLLGSHIPRVNPSGPGLNSNMHRENERRMLLPSWPGSRQFYKKKAPTYDGQTNLQEYMVLFEMIAELNGWDDFSKAMELATSLRGAAQGILSDMRPELRTNYTYLVAALTSRFEPTNQTELYRAQMKSRLRRKSESVQELAQDVKRLVRMAYPSASLELREQLSRDCFVDALNDKELEWTVYQGKPKTVDEAVQLALEYEAFQKGKQRYSVPPRGLRMQHELENCVSTCNQGDSPSINDLMGRLAKVEVRLNENKTNNNQPQPQPQQNQGPNGRRKGKCNYCGKKGHWKFECRKRKYDLAQQTRTKTTQQDQTATGMKSENAKKLVPRVKLQLNLGVDPVKMLMKMYNQNGMVYI